MSTLGLKWGTWKSMDFKDTPAAKPLLAEYSTIGSSAGAMTQHDTPRQKEILCELIDLVTDPRGIYLDWDGKYVSKEEAKTYVLNYDKD